MTDDPVGRILGELPDSPPVRPVDGFGFVDPRAGLLTAELVDAVVVEGPIRTGLGARLWWWRGGVWVPGGEAEVTRRTRKLLGNKWRRAHADTVAAWLAADHPFITDRQPVDVINCRNGLLDWRTGVLRPHEPDVPTTFQVSVDWNPDAECPAVDAWIADVFPSDAHQFAFEVLGYLLYGDNPFHVAVLCYGTGRNGKGTFLRLTRKLLGSDHVSAVTLQGLAENRFSAAELYGKVANVAGDLDARTLARTDLFKMATGGDPISAEVKFGQPFTFIYRGKFVFAANELPGTVDHTEGFFSRWLVVPFSRYFPAGVADPTIEPRLHAELEGVLTRSVAGLRRLMDRGRFDPPTSILEATADYRARADAVRQFTDERLELTPNGQVRRKDVYDAYRSWCDDNGHRPLSAGKFYSRLRGVHPSIDTEHKTAGVRHIAGATLTLSTSGQVGQL